MTKFCDLFAKHQKLEWIFIGVQNSDVLQFNKCIRDLFDNKRIRAYAWMNDLRSFYEHCNAYVHMPRMIGGGWGIGLAVTENLPVLALRGNDSDNFLPDISLYADDDEFWEKLHEILNESINTEQYLFEQEQEFNKHSPIKVGEELNQIVLKILDNI